MNGDSHRSSNEMQPRLSSDPEQKHSYVQHSQTHQTQNISTKEQPKHPVPSDESMNTSNTPNKNEQYREGASPTLPTTGNSCGGGIQANEASTKTLNKNQLARENPSRTADTVAKQCSRSVSERDAQTSSLMSSSGALTRPSLDQNPGTAQTIENNINCTTTKGKDRDDTNNVANFEPENTADTNSVSSSHRNTSSAGGGDDKQSDPSEEYTFSFPEGGLVLGAPGSQVRGQSNREGQDEPEFSFSFSEGVLGSHISSVCNAQKDSKSSVSQAGPMPKRPRMANWIFRKDKPEDPKTDDDQSMEMTEGPRLRISNVGRDVLQHLREEELHQGKYAFGVISSEGLTEDELEKRRAEIAFQMHMGDRIKCECCVNAHKRWKDEYKVDGDYDNPYDPKLKYTRKKKTVEQHYIDKIKEGYRAKIERVNDDKKGRIMVAKESLTKGDFCCEYRGQLISATEAYRREEIYSEMDFGCYMYYFEHNGSKHW